MKTHVGIANKCRDVINEHSVYFDEKATDILPPFRNNCSISLPHGMSLNVFLYWHGMWFGRAFANRTLLTNKAGNIGDDSKKSYVKRIFVN